MAKQIPRSADQLSSALSQGLPSQILRSALVLVGLLVLCLAINLPWRAYWHTRLARDLELNGQSVKAEVLSQTRCDGKHGPVPCFEISYRVQGKSYRNKDRHPDLRPGQSLSLRYAPLDPAFYRFSSDPPAPAWDQGFTPKMLITSLLGLFFGLIGWQILRQAWQGKFLPPS